MSKTNNQQTFLLTFFNSNEYQEKFVHGYWLVKHWNGHTEKWQVAIYSEDSFREYKKFAEKMAKIKEQNVIFPPSLDEIS